MKKAILFLSSLFCSGFLFSQTTVITETPSANQNYIRTRTYTEAPDSKNPNGVYLDKINYFDGLGRSIQEIQRGISPTGKDHLIIQEYDSYGRESKSWLPMNSGRNDASIRPKNEIEYLFKNLYENDSAYSRPVYENSPLNRVIEQYGPGKAWHTNKRSIKTEYLTNTGTSGALSCAKFIVDGQTITAEFKQGTDKYYANGELFVTKITDEDNNVGYEFKDKLGKVILTRQINNNESHDTHYIYDNFENLRAVFPPMASDMIYKDPKQLERYSDMRAKWAYMYVYDSRNRCIQKKLPGCDWIYYVYDNADRVIFTQDGVQRKNKEWTFSIPDSFGRIVLSGICKNTIDYSTDQLKGRVITATWNGSNDYKGYTINNTSLYNPTLLTVNYYDDYRFITENIYPDSIKSIIPFANDTEYGSKYANAKGLPTGSMVKYIESNGKTEKHTVSSIYYDERGRVIQTRTTKHTGGRDISKIMYNFAGSPVKKRISHVFHDKANKKMIEETYAYTYDHAGRLRTTSHQIDKNKEVILADNYYDELGRLDSTIANNQSKLALLYSYNIRSWITQISGPLMSHKLYYEQIEKSEGTHGITQPNIPSYNGNISKILSGSNQYNLEYDGLSRLKGAYTIKRSITRAPVYSTAYTYDKHGNIKTLQRFGQTDEQMGQLTGLIDNLEISYDGNQLRKVSDYQDPIHASNSYDFKDGANIDKEYSFNENGALIQDLNKGITSIAYNILNQPREMVINSEVTKGKNYYTYSASGTKLKTEQKYNVLQSVTPVAGTTPLNDGLNDYSVTQYMGNIIQEITSINNVKKEKIRILVDGGYYENGKYYFYLKDHLGNNKVVVDGEGTVIQRIDYYPFGMSFLANKGEEEQRYKYNGKEFDTMHGLNQYDYGARYYDPALPRFTTVDPHAENYFSWSPYAYCANNPLRITDPTGLDWFFHEDSGALIYRKGVKSVDGLTAKDRLLLNDWKRIGDDSMFDRDYLPLSTYESINRLDFYYQSQVNRFIEMMQFTKVEVSLAEEMKIEMKDGFKSQSGKIETDVVLSKPRIINNYITFVKNENTIRRIIKKRSKVGEWYSFNTIESVTYEYTRPYKQKIESYYQNDDRLPKALAASGEAFLLLIELLKK